MGEIKTVIDKDKGLTLNTVSGAFTIDELISAIIYYMEEGITEKVLWNFLEADGSGISPEDIRKMYVFIKNDYSHVGKRRIALVVKSDFGFGISRVAQTYAEVLKLPSHYYITRDLDDAMKWLEKGLK